MTDRPSFEPAASWTDAARLVPFEPLEPRETAGRTLQSLTVFVRDHRQREVRPDERSLEAFYDGFVFTQRQAGEAAAREAALETSYGASPREVTIGDAEGRAYERGPEPPVDDPDPRMPSVVVWADGPMLFLVASEEFTADELLPIARSVR